MLDDVIMGVIFGFALLGMFSVIYYLLFVIRTPGKKTEYFVIIPLKERDDPLNIVSVAIEKRSLMAEGRNCEIICVDCGMEEDTARFVKNLYGKTKNIKITDCKGILPLIESELIKKMQFCTECDK